MAITLSGTVQSTTTLTVSNTQDFSSIFSGSPGRTFARALNSTDITKAYFHTYSVTSTPTSVDLTALTDVFGTAVSFSTVKHLLVWNNSTSINLTVGGGTNGLFAALPFTLSGQAASSGGGSAGSCLNLTANITVDGTHKILTLTAASGTIVVDVFVLGS